MKKLALPLAKPSINGYQFHAYYLSILEQHEETIPWIMNNFISVSCNSNFEKIQGIYFHFNIGFSIYTYPLYNPYLQSERISKEHMEAFDLNIIDVIKNSLVRGKYVYMGVDRYFMDYTDEYLREHLGHDLMIFGFDDDKEIFLGLAYDQKANFAEVHIQYKNMISSFQRPNCKGLSLLNFTDKSNFKKNLDLDQIKKHVGIYLLGRSITENYTDFIEPMNSENFDFGINIYDCFVKYNQSLLANKIDFSMIHYHLFWEHKKLMVRRMAYLENKGLVKCPLSDDYARDVEKRMYAIRNMMLVYKNKRDLNLIKKINLELMNVKKREQAILLKFVDSIKI